jgi:DNA polymerase-1
MIEATPGPFLDTLKRYKEATKTLSTYINPYAAAAASDDHRMHNEYTAWNTVVGRTSARGANVQNLDRDYKSFFSAPPRALAVEADYSALHFRLAAFNASEATIIERYREDPNWDPHLFFGRLFYGRENITPLERQIAKSGNFSQLYMGEAHTLQTYAKGLGISLSMRTCRELHETWHIAFPGFRPWYVSVMDELLANGYVETVTGRRRHFGDVRKMSRIGRQGALREAVNFKVLGLEPDIALLALAECHTGGLPINYFGHDAIRFEFPSRVDYDNHKHLIRPCMIDRPLAILRDEFGVNLTVPLEIEIKLYDA